MDQDVDVAEALEEVSSETFLRVIEVMVVLIKVLVWMERITEIKKWKIFDMISEKNLNNNNYHLKDHYISKF
jgi:hypothetical protein